MTIRIYSIALVTTTIFAFGIHAAELNQEIPVGLAKALIQIPFDGEVRFYDSPPETFPEFTVPDDFDVVGGVTMLDAGLSQVVLSSGHELSVGLNLLLDSLQNDTYVLQLKMPQMQRGFVSDANFTTVYNLCNDDLGALSIRALRRGSDNLYAISGNKLTIDSSGSTCGDRIASAAESYNRMEQINNRGMRADFPLLSAPLEKNSDSQGSIIGSRSSGGNGYYETSSQLTTGHTAPFVHIYFTEQLTNQGWELVQDISDQESNWRITIEDRALFGELKIGETEEGVLNLYFRISKDAGLYIEDSLLSPRRSSN